MIDLELLILLWLKKEFLEDAPHHHHHLFAIHVGCRSMSFNTVLAHLSQEIINTVFV
jgi:hypothetical protein